MTAKLVIYFIPALLRRIDPWKSPESGTTGETACPTTEYQQIVKLVGQAFSLSKFCQGLLSLGDGLFGEPVKSSTRRRGL
jgi:hypothetical protein